MDFATGIIFVLVTTFALSYGWGMRGLLVGGEKGAMVPGAMLGIMLAWFSGSEVVRENYWFLASAGLMAMTFGGTETYGETIGMVLKRDSETYNPVKGYGGLALKGALWFSVAAGFIGMTFGAMTGEIYKWYDIVALFVAMPLLQEIGYRIFNTPYDKQAKKFPKIFFSLTRREEWGRNVFVLLEIVVLSVVRGDWFTLIMAAAGAISGAVGWLVAMRFYVLSAYPMKNSKWFFGILSKKKLVEGWKTMEFTLGAFGGLGISLCWWICFGMVEERSAVIERNGGVWSAFGESDIIGSIAVTACMALLLAMNIWQYYKYYKKEKVNSFIYDLLERPLYCNIPLALVMLGSAFSARIMSFFMLFFAMALKCAYDRFVDYKTVRIWQVVLTLCSFAVFVGDILLGGYSVFATWFVCTVPYLALDLVHFFRPESLAVIKERKAKGESALRIFGIVFIWFTVQIIVLNVIGLKLF